MTDKYTVWHATAKHDGDDAFDNLAEAEAEFERQCDRPNVVEVELQDNTDPNNPIVLRAKRPG